MQHDKARRDRLEFFGSGNAGQGACRDDFAPDVVVGFDFIAPEPDAFSVFVGAVFRFVDDDGFNHAERGGIER